MSSNSSHVIAFSFGLIFLEMYEFHFTHNVGYLVPILLFYTDRYSINLTSMPDTNFTPPKKKKKEKRKKSNYWTEPTLVDDFSFS